jgi:hypothetical protein
MLAPEAKFSDKARWAALRVLFLGCVGWSMLTGAGFYLLAPYFSYCLFRSLRFWRYLPRSLQLIRHTYRLAFMALRGDLVLSLPLAAPPADGPDLDIVRTRDTWPYGETCGPCRICCRMLGCPLLNGSAEGCTAYGSFFWRFFNCGRYPTSQEDITRYGCPKWEMKVSIRKPIISTPGREKIEPGERSRVPGKVIGAGRGGINELQVTRDGPLR